jgi:hypothetical protein
MNILVTRLFQPAPVGVAITLLALAALTLAAATGFGAQQIAVTDVAPFRWA